MVLVGVLIESGNLLRLSRDLSASRIIRPLRLVLNVVDRSSDSELFA